MTEKGHTHFRLGPLKFNIEFAVEIEEEHEDGQYKVTVSLQPTCNGQPPPDASENVFTLDFEGHPLIFYSHLEDAFKERLPAILPPVLMQQAIDSLFEAINKEASDDDYVPPKTSRDWTTEKLRQASLKALLSLPYYENPTYKKVAEIISKRYSRTLDRPLTGEALRKLFERLGLDWREIKEWQKSRQRRKRTNLK